MTPEILTALLGRSLTGVEVTNLALLLGIARTQLEELICSRIGDTTEARSFIARPDYRTVFVPIFTTIVSVTVNGQPRLDYTKQRQGSLNGAWFNQIVFTEAVSGTVTVVADWGFVTVPNDILMLEAHLFEVAANNRKGTDKVSSKKVEDFSISFRDSSEEQSFIDKHDATLRKYSSCNQAEVVSGDLYGLIL